MLKIQEPIEPLLEKLIQIAKQRNVQDLAIVFPTDYNMKAILDIKEFKDDEKNKVIIEGDNLA